MKQSEIYNRWKQEKLQIDSRENFMDAVMNQVYQYQQDRSKQFFRFRWLVDVVSEHPLAQASLVVIGTVTGLIRVAFVICMFLRT
jgi:hypothetical protein